MAAQTSAVWLCQHQTVVLLDGPGHLDKMDDIQQEEHVKRSLGFWNTTSFEGC